MVERSLDRLTCRTCLHIKFECCSTSNFINISSGLKSFVALKCNFALLLRWHYVFIPNAWPSNTCSINACSPTGHRIQLPRGINNLKLDRIFTTKVNYQILFGSPKHTILFFERHVFVFIKSVTLDGWIGRMRWKWFYGLLAVIKHQKINTLGWSP